MSISKVIKSLREHKLPPIKEIPSPLLKTIGTMGKIGGKFSRLTPVERVLTTIQHKEPDRVPVSPMAGAVGRQIRGISFREYSLHAEKAAEVFTSTFQLVGGDLVVLMLDLSIEAADFGQKVVFPENSTAYSDYDDPVIKEIEDYRRIKPVRLSDSKRMKEFVRLCSLVIILGTGQFLFPLFHHSNQLRSEAEQSSLHRNFHFALCWCSLFMVVEFSNALSLVYSHSYLKITVE